jgi:CRP/FNR family transcriptional regulator, cyclic AMP receptor protein
MEATIEQLARVQVLKPLDVSALTRLQPHSWVRGYQSNEIVMHEGDRLPAQLYALVDGIVEIKKTASTGKETLVRIIIAGELFAAPAIFGNGIAPATVSTQVNSQVLTVKREALLDTIAQTPEVALHILEVFNQRLQQLHDTIHGLISERALVRMIRLIQYYASHYGTEVTSNGEYLKVKLPYYQMARSVGITYEECVRLMKTLKSAIAYQRGGKILVKNWQELDAIAISAIGN